MDFEPPNEELIQDLRDLALRLRIHSINATIATKSGHPTSCSSIAEIMSVLFFHTLHLNVNSPGDLASDRFILSKGHTLQILYAAWAEIGYIPIERLKHLGEINNKLPSSLIDFNAGSLGQGLAVAAGMAYVGKYLDKASYRVYVLIGDGESSAGSIWESLHFASHYKLDNLCVILDVNRWGQSGMTPLQHNLEEYCKRLGAFGFNTLIVDGHDVTSLCESFHIAANTKIKPTAIIAKTIKGKFFPDIEDNENWHEELLGDKALYIIDHLQGLMFDTAVHLPAPKSLANGSTTHISANNLTAVKLSKSPDYSVGDAIATRLAYGNALVKLAENNQYIIALDSDTKDATFSYYMKEYFPERFIECFIAQQNMVGVAIGAACRERTIPFVSTIAAYLTRAFDQLRMGAISQTKVVFVGSHCGANTGNDGLSQMSLEDIAMFRAIPGSTIFYPSDAVSCERAAELASNIKGISYIRTSDERTTIIYDNLEKFVVGKGKVVKKTENDKVLLIGAGITLFECFKAAAELEKNGVNARIIDPFTVKPLDVDLILENGRECYGNVVVVEDHYQQGGLGEAVLSELAMHRDFVTKHLYVNAIPCLGPLNEVIDTVGISARHVVMAAKVVLDPKYGPPYCACGLDEDM